MLNKKEIKSLTGIRGVAALYVVIHHFWGYYYESTNNQGFFCKGAWGNFFLHGYLAVDLFFLLSAFVISYASEKIFDNRISAEKYFLFMKKRWVRIYPSYFLLVVLGFMFIQHFHRVANFVLSLTLMNIVFNLSYLFGHIWSLGAEWIIYLIFPVLFLFSRLKQTNAWNAVVFLTGLIILLALSIVENGGLKTQMGLELFQGYPALIRCLGDYCIGLSVYNFYKKNNSELPYSNFSSIILAICLIGSLFFIKIDLISILISALFILSISTDYNIIAKFLSSKVIYFLGVISYPLYLFHFIVYLNLSTLQSYIPRFSLLFIIYLIASIFIGWFITICVEKPIIKILNKKLF